MRRPSRRGLLGAVATGAAAGLAGCFGAPNGYTDAICGTDPVDEESTVRTDVAGTAPVPDDDWPQFGRDAGRTGHTDAAGPVDGVGVGWARSLDAYGVAWPVLAGERLVVTESSRGAVYGLDPADGTVRWTDDRVTDPAPPAVLGDLAVVPARTGLHAFALDDGTHRWRFAPAPERADTTATERSAWFHGPPVVAGDAVLAATSRGVHAVGLDGTERWRVPDAGVGVVDDGTAYLPADDLLVVDLATGERRRSVDGAGDRLAARDGVVYAGRDGRVVAVDPADGSRAWTFEGESEVFASPAVTSDLVLAASKPAAGGGEDGGNLYALERATGEPAWCRYFGFEPVRAPVATDDAVYVATEGALDARRLDDGSPLFRYAESDATPDFRAPVVAGDVCYFGTDDGVVRALAER